MNAHPVSIRAATRDDIPFIMDSWLSSHRQSYHVRGIEGQVYYREQRRVCEVLLQRGAVLMACDVTHPTSIFGWCCCEVVDRYLVVHFVYVRGGFQDLGIGTKLVKLCLDQEPGLAAVVYTHQTKAGRRWAEKMAPRAPEVVEGTTMPVVYNPYFLYQTLGAQWS
jgi:GNAT superfamily N-acetyltransferase